VIDAVLVSDLHLGSEGCQVLALQRFLEDIPSTPRLVLNGDVLENTEYRLTKQHWRVLSQLRKLSDQLELVWVRGNHDEGAEAVAHLIGAAFLPEYEFDSGGKRFLCVHGDIWDRWLTAHPILTIMADWFYLRLQRMSRRLAFRAKRRSKTFLRCAERVRAEAIEYGKVKEADAIICGHTHHMEPPPDPSSRPLYYNTGCWTDHHRPYLVVEDGVVGVHEFEGEGPPPSEVPPSPSVVVTAAAPSEASAAL
jgi:UDP-2,3-diacylglucosamine pyrophosphatase LpxH